MFYKGYAINFYFVTSYAEHILSSLSAFFFGTRGARKKLGKKETPRLCFAACARRPTLRALDRRLLFKKSNAKTFDRLRHYVVKKL